MSPLTRQSRVVTWLAFLAGLAITAPLLAADPRARTLATNTLLLSGIVAAASVAIGAPWAFLLARTNIRGRQLASGLVVALVFMPLYLQAAAWQAGFGLQGWFTAATGAGPLLDGWRGALVIHTLAAIPWVILIVGVGLRMAEPELEEEALLNGTPAQVFWRVTLWRAAEAAGVAALWVAVTTAGEMTVTDLFQVRTYAEQLYTEFALGDSLGAAPWKLLPSAIATVWAIVAGLLLTSRLVPPDRFPTMRRPRDFRLGRWRLPVSLATWACVAVLVGVPAGSMVVKAGTIVARDGPNLVRRWSGEQFASMIFGSPGRFAREFGWSLSIGLLAATVAVAIGLWLAWNARRGGWRAVGVWLAVATSLSVPGPLVGLALIALFNEPRWPWLVEMYDRSILVVCLAQTVRVLPLCTLVLWYALRAIPAELLSSATLDGASGAVQFFRIALPQRWAAVAAAWLLALALAWGELSASILVVPPGVVTLPIQIFNLIHYGVDDRVAGISLDVMAMYYFLALVCAILARRTSRRISAAAA